MILNPFHFKKENEVFYPFVTSSRRNRLILHTLFWIISCAVFMLLVSFIRSPGEALLRSVAIIICFMLVFYGSKVLVRRYYEKKRYDRWLLLTCSWVFVVAGFRVWIDLNIIKSALFRPGTILIFNSDKTLKLYLFYLLITLVLISLGSLYHIAKNRLSLEHHYFKLKIQHVETQLNFLKAQVNPHFLFNTLNNIYAAAELKNPNAPGMILQLSQLLRYITYTVQQKKINLTEEWEQVENYVKLFCSRNPEFKHPVELIAEGELENVKVPPMLLLPLVENAIKYSDIHEQIKDSFLKIHLISNPGQLQFNVSNTYCDDNHHHGANSGLGNQNLIHRLELEYPKKFTLHTEKEPRIFTANLTINYHD